MDSDTELIVRLEEWAHGLDDQEFTDAASPDYREGFRDARSVVLGLIQAWAD